MIIYSKIDRNLFAFDHLFVRKYRHFRKWSMPIESQCRSFGMILQSQPSFERVIRRQHTKPFIIIIEYREIIALLFSINLGGKQKKRNRNGKSKEKRPKKKINIPMAFEEITLGYAANY